jgi:hypothetical protein
LRLASSQGGHLRPRGYLTGAEAVDVARLTRLPLTSARHRPWEAPDIAPDAVTAAADVYLDLTRLDWFDRMRVAFARIGGHYFLKGYV